MSKREIKIFEFALALWVTLIVYFLIAKQ